jgi:hypothetical protein
MNCILEYFTLGTKLNDHHFSSTVPMCLLFHQVTCSVLLWGLILSKPLSEAEILFSPKDRVKFSKVISEMNN